MHRPRRHGLCLLSLLVTGLLAATPTRAQDKTAEIDKIFSWVKPGMPGCVAAASQNGKLVVNRAYGLADLERNVPLTTDSVFDAASIRKQFVAAAILLLVEDEAPVAVGRRPQVHPGTAGLRPHDHAGPHAHPHQRHARLDVRSGHSTAAASRRMRDDPAAARPQFRARRGVVLLEQRLRAAHRDRRARQRRCRSPSSRGRACSSRSG